MYFYFRVLNQYSIELFDCQETVADILFQRTEGKLRSQFHSGINFGKLRRIFIYLLNDFLLAIREHMCYTTYNRENSEHRE